MLPLATYLPTYIPSATDNITRNRTTVSCLVLGGARKPRDPEDELQMQDTSQPASQPASQPVSRLGGACSIGSVRRGDKNNCPSTCMRACVGGQRYIDSHPRQVCNCRRPMTGHFAWAVRHGWCRSQSCSAKPNTRSAKEQVISQSPTQGN
jgi:hypothetical protein